MDPSMILYTEDSPHFHSAEDAVNAHSASPWRSAEPSRVPGKLRRVGTSTFTSKSWTAMMAYLMVSLLNDTTCPTLVTTLSWVQALRHHYPFCHHVGRTFWTLELVWTLRPSLHH